MKSTGMVAKQSPNREGGLIYVLPFVITLFVCTFYFKLPQENQGGSLAFLNNPSRLIGLGFSYLLAFTLIIKRIKRSAFIISRNKIIILLISYILISMLWSKYPVKVIINWGHNIGIVFVVVSAIFYIQRNPKKFFFILCSYSFVAVTASLIIGLFIPERGIHVISGRWMGITTNPNSLGAICFFSVWANLAYMGFDNNKRIRWFCILTIAITLFVIFKANSITSIVCTLFIIGCTQYVKIIRNNPTHLIVVKLFLVIISISLLILLVVAIRPELLSTDAILSGVGRNQNLTGRVGLWGIGYTLLLSKPFLGWGFDSLASALSTNVIETGQFHNGYLDLCIRGGLVGAVLIIMLFLKFLRNCIEIVKENSHVPAMHMILVFAILLHNLTEASILRSTHLLWILFLFSYFHIDYLRSLSKAYRKQWRL